MVGTTVFFKLDTQMMIAKVTNLVDAGPSGIVTKKIKQTRIQKKNLNLTKCMPR